MNPINEIAEWLTSRRANVTPEQVGLTSDAERPEGLAPDHAPSPPNEA
ncbi:MAG TPA: hypothetical protein VGK92_00575 [Gaiellales bacterium]